MSLVIAYNDTKTKTTYMGADSISICNNSKRILGQDKIIKKGEFMFGITGTLRYSQILEHLFELPINMCEENHKKYICGDFIQCLKQCFVVTDNYVKSTNEEMPYFAFLCTYKGILFTIYDNFSIEFSNEDFMGCGCGDDAASTALNILSKHDNTPERIINETFETVFKYTNAIAPPFYIKSMQYGE